MEWDIVFALSNQLGNVGGHPVERIEGGIAECCAAYRCCMEATAVDGIVLKTHIRMVKRPKGVQPLWEMC